MKSFNLRKEDVNREWHLVDAQDAILGRLASSVAHRLMGKHKVDYTFHTDNGDYVVVVNAAKIKVSGNKSKAKLYHRHSTQPGHLKTSTFTEMMNKKPERVIELAVRRMLPKNRIARQMLTRLRIFADASHTHKPQNPVELKI